MVATRDCHISVRDGEQDISLGDKLFAIMPSLFHESVVDLLEETLTCEIVRAMGRLRTRAGRKLAVELGKVYKVSRPRLLP
jgi:hypothetical protein